MPVRDARPDFLHSKPKLIRHEEAYFADLDDDELSNF
jgi:hypothetical protein